MTAVKNPTIGIIGGTGKIGQWFKHFFESQGLTVYTVGQQTKMTSEALVKKSQIVIVSVPISQTQKVLSKITPLMSENMLLSDTTSFKVMPLEAMKQSKSATLGMHPLFGPSASVSQGLKIVFCKQKNNQYVKFLEDLFKRSGIEVVEMSAEEHDYQMAYIQAFTHAVNLLYAKIIFEQKNMLENKLLTPIFSLQALVMGRVLHQDLELISDIQFYNPYFPPVLKAFIEQAKRLESIISREDKTAFYKMFMEEKNLAKDFSNYSAFQTDKILNQLSEINPSLPQKAEPVVLTKKGQVGYLGPEGTFSSEATNVIFSKKEFKKVPYDSIFDIFNAINNNDILYGVIPAENSIEGMVKGVLDYLADFSLYVLGSFDLPIRHQLLSFEKNLSDIKVIVSHPQALAQCKNWIKNNLPNAKLSSSISTTSDIENKAKGYGYIASEIASRRYKIPILIKNIEDEKSNTTKFYLLSKRKTKIVGIQNNHTLLFLTVYNRVGILRDILDVFAKHGINLTKLESRPSHEKLWDYHFFVEIESTNREKGLLESLKELKAYCSVIRVLGET